VRALRLAISLALIALPAGTAALAAQPPRDPRTAARTYREAHEAAILRELTDLLALPNLASDTPAIRRNAEALLTLLRRRGVTAKLLELDGSPPAVFGELRTPGATRTMVLYAHYDGQPVDPAQWTGAPWTPVLRDRALTAGGKDVPFPAEGARVDPEARVYARSASDDKGAIIAMLTALDALRTAGTSPSVNLKFFFEGEEEAGSPHLKQILERYQSELSADGWLFCDGPVHQSGQMQVLFGLRGVTGLELTIYGPNRALHSGHYGNWAPNPGALLANLIASMRDDDGRIKIAGFYDDVRAISPSERRAIAAVPPIDTMLRRTFALAASEASNAPISERIMLPALNVRGMRVGAVGAQAANAIPTEARASFDFRLVPNQTPANVRRLVEAHLARQGYFVTADSVTDDTRRAHAKIARVQWEMGYPASRTSMDLPFSRAVLAAIGSGAARPPLAVPTLGGSGPTYLFEQVLQVPMLVVPIANFDNNQHAFNENIRVQNLWDGIEMFASLMARVGTEWQGGRIVP
jgi:acetylornithine deacetylase/succinyl-diaminopimelate desuccinylase-like protein